MDTESQILNVPIEDIIPNRFQPRLNFDEEALKELSESIKEHGIIQPLVLRRVNDKYEIIAGERRYKAAKLAGLTGVPAIISKLDDQKSAEVSIVENVQRKDLSAIEEAKSYKALLDKGYLTQEELAKKMGLSQSAISNKLRLLNLSEKIQNALMENKISERHARSLLQLKEKEEQDKWLDKIINERLTVRELDMNIKEEIKDNDDTIKDEVPVIGTKPNLEVIKENATDIIPPSDTPKQIVEERVIEEKPIPNKFFNYLEDEEANMSMVEPISSNLDSQIEMLENDMSTPTSIPEAESNVIENPISIDINEDIVTLPPQAAEQIEENFEPQNNLEEESVIDIPIDTNIEETPESIEENSTTVEENKNDSDNINNLMQILINNLNVNYEVNVEKAETDSDIKYTITIQK